MTTDVVDHFALSGEHVTNDWNLISQLRETAHVSLLNGTIRVNRDLPACGVGLVVLECPGSQALESDIVPLVRAWKSRFPDLVIILINGGLTQKDIVLAFREGINDYFAFPYDVHLLFDRIHHLIGLAKRNQN